MRNVSTRIPDQRRRNAVATEPATEWNGTIIGSRGSGPDARYAYPCTLRVPLTPPPRIPMIERRLPLLASALLAALFAVSAHAAPVRTGHVEAELIAQKTAFVAGSDNVVALRLTLDRGWHTYWRNAGDSGLPTTLAWTLPAGVRAGPIEWLPPKLLPAGPLTNYRFENVALHPVRLTTSAAFAGGNAVTL